MDIKSFTAYFRRLAVAHQGIKHNPLSETGDAPIGEKRFTRFGVEEVVTGLRNKISFPALLLENYERKLTGSTIHDVKGSYNGAFSILCTANAEKPNDVETAFDLSEKIMNEMLAQIWQDHYGPNADKCERVFTNISFSGMDVSPIGPVFDSQFGWRCEFSFNNNQKLNLAPVAGTFIF